MKYRAGVNISDGPVWAQIFDLPGCAVTAQNVAEVEDLLPLAASLHVSWLIQHGEQIDQNSFEVDVVERVDARLSEAQDGEFCYEDDLRPLTDDDIAAGLRAMSYAREDLLDVVDGLSAEVMDWRPPASAMAHIDPWQPEPLTIREIVATIASSEGYYRGCLQDGTLTDSKVLDLAGQRELTVARFTGLSSEERGRLYYPRTPWGEKPEHWTARKALRRIIAHERFHTAEIQQRLAWILVGVPEYGARRLS